MEIVETSLPGVVVIKPSVHADSRGFFLETYHEQRYRDLGITDRFVQDNHSRSGSGVLRGLHLQLEHAQGKLVSAMTGRIWDVAADVDPTSSTFRKWFGTELSDENHHQLYIPAGYAHGFVVLSDSADVCYKCTDFYTQGDEAGILWNDPELAISWPIGEPIVSGKDQANPTLQAYLERLDR